MEKKKPPYRSCRNFANVVLEPLVPLLQQCLLKQAEDVDEFSDDTWNVATASGNYDQTCYLANLNAPFRSLPVAIGTSS